jgi:hypothetical protein
MGNLKMNNSSEKRSPNSRRQIFTDGNEELHPSPTHCCCMFRARGPLCCHDRKVETTRNYNHNRWPSPRYGNKVYIDSSMVREVVKNCP